MSAFDFDGLVRDMHFDPCPGGCGESTMNGRMCPRCYDARDERSEATRTIVTAERSIPRHHVGACFDAPETLRARVASANAIAIAQAAIGASRVTMLGPAGSGKTTLAVAMMRAWMRARTTPALFVPAYRLGVVRSQHHLGDGEPQLVDDAMAAELLVLDDIGSERRTPTNAVPDVIFERHAEERPTIITTGFAEEEVARTYGDGIARRVFEGAKVIRLGATP